MKVSSLARASSVTVVTPLLPPRAARRQERSAPVTLSCHRWGSGRPTMAGGVKRQRRGAPRRGRSEAAAMPSLQPSITTSTRPYQVIGLPWGHEPRLVLQDQSGGQPPARGHRARFRGRRSDTPSKGGGVRRARRSGTTRRRRWCAAVRSGGSQLRWSTGTAAVDVVPVALELGVGHVRAAVHGRRHPVALDAPSLITSSSSDQQPAAATNPAAPPVVDHEDRRGAVIDEVALVLQQLEARCVVLRAGRAGSIQSSATPSKAGGASGRPSRTVWTCW